MPITLSKNQGISLAKAAPAIVHARVGLGWNPRATDGAPFDLDASVLMCDSTGKAISDSHFIFYNQLQDTAGSVIHNGDNRTGEGDGDDESVDLYLDKIPAEVAKLAIVVSIDQPQARRQNFGMVADAYVRLFDAENEQDSTTLLFELNEDASTQTCILFAELIREDGSWTFKAIGKGWPGVNDLGGVLAQYGLVAS